jgi:Flp pilus assembly protein TadD
VARADLEVAARLEKIRLDGATVRGKDGEFAFTWAANEYAQAFKDVGLEGVEEDEAVARLRESAIREELVAGLDNWASVTADSPLRARLFRLARRADPDPKWRDLPGLEKVLQEAPVGELPPQLLKSLEKLPSRHQLPDSEALLRAAQRRRPDDFWINFHLANFLMQHGKPDRAVGFYRAALTRRPRNVSVHNNLSVVLRQTGQLEESLAACERAAELDPTHAGVQMSRGNTLRFLGRLDEAEAAYRRAVALALPEVKRDSRFAARAHNNHGAALAMQGRTEEALAAFDKAIELDKELEEIHINRASTLGDLARFAESRAAVQPCLKLPRESPVRQYAQAQLQRWEHLQALEARLPAVLEGKEKPAHAVEQRDLAFLCSLKRLHAASARFYAAAFAAQPKLADNLASLDRYHAACAAVAASHSPDSEKLSDAERARLRRQGVEWLTADLTAWAALLKKTPQERLRARFLLGQWKANRLLAGIRDADELAKLTAEEQDACRKLWEEVEALLQQSSRE